MKILVLWADSKSANLGVQVLALGMRELAIKAWGPDVSVDFQDYGVGDSPIGFGNKNIARDFGRKNGVLKNKLRQYDLILDSGAGDSFTDIYGFQRLLWMANAHRIARKLSIPVVFGPQTFGPFNTLPGRFMGARMLRNAAQVHARDSESSSYARSILGRAPDVTSTDVVFALAQPKPDVNRDVLLNVSGLLWKDNSHVEHEEYQRVVRALITELTSAGREVSLLSHVIDNPRSDNDVHVCQSIARDSGAEVVIPKSLSEARDIIGSSRLVIGSRMHACLNALSTEVPAIPMAYSRKFKPLMDNLGWSYGVDLRDKSGVVDKVLENVSHIERGLHEPQLQSLLSKARSGLDATVAKLSELR